MDLYQMRAEPGKADIDMRRFLHRVVGLALFGITHGLRVDYAHALHILAPHCQQAAQIHMTAALVLLGYIKYRIDECLGIVYWSAQASWIEYPKLIVSTDASLGNICYRSGYGIVIELLGATIYVAAGTIKAKVTYTSMAEFMAHVSGLKVSISLQGHMFEIGLAPIIQEAATANKLAQYAEQDRILMLCDNMAASKVATTGQSMKKMRHMALKELFVLDSVGRQHDIMFQPGKFMKADIVTKDVKEPAKLYRKVYSMLWTYFKPQKNG